MKAPADRPILAGLSRDELLALATGLGEPAYRARQLGDWVFRQLTVDPAAMNNLPATWRRKLSQTTLAPSSRLMQRETDGDGTTKLLIELSDGEQIESVVIPTPERTTCCLSTQVGCPVRCAFCASGADGLVRNLRTGEIIEQFLHAAEAIGGRPDNLVFMGIGEGLLNFAALSKALTLLTTPDGFALSPRRITVSTSGIVPGIRALAAMRREFNLAISLHAADEETRAGLIPAACRYPIAEIMAAADEYRELAGRMVTLEYTLLAGVNDSDRAARALGELSRRHHAKVNLIPYNETGGKFKRPAAGRIDAFLREVRAAGGAATLRRERGGKRLAACGQLRNTKGKI